MSENLWNSVGSRCSIPLEQECMYSKFLFNFVGIRRQTYEIFKILHLFKRINVYELDLLYLSKMKKSIKSYLLCLLSILAHLTPCHRHQDIQHLHNHFPRNLYQLGSLFLHLFLLSP